MAKGIARLMLIFISVIAVSLSPLQCFALDERYVSSSEYWNDRGTSFIVEDDEDDFSSLVKYYFDEETASMYFYINYTYGKVKRASSDNVCIVFTVSNETDSYKVYVTKNGFTGEGESDISNAFGVISNFDDAVTRTGNGKVMIGIELIKNSLKTSYNTIDIDYFCGDISHNVFEGLTFDLTPETTTKITTTKPSKATSSKSTQANEKDKVSTTSKSSSSSTKFKGYADSDYATVGDETAVEDEAYTTSKAYNNANEVSKIRYGNSTIVFIIISSAIILTGIFLTAYGWIKSKKKNVPSEDADEETTEQTDNDNNDTSRTED